MTTITPGKVHVQLTAHPAQALVYAKVAFCKKARKRNFFLMQFYAFFFLQENLF